MGQFVKSLKTVMLTWKIMFIKLVTFLAFYETNHHKFTVQKSGSYSMFTRIHRRSSLFNILWRLCLWWVAILCTAYTTVLYVVLWKKN